MSWYVSQDGEQLWIARDETVYTLVEGDEKKLPHENLTYLTVSSRKTVYHEHIVDEDLFPDGKSRVPRKHREKQTGRQRGFVLRAEVEDSPLSRVVPCFKAMTQKLVDDGDVSRVDADDAVNTKRKKNKDEKRPNLQLGVNECRVETTARINHFAHGAGFRVEVSQGSVFQRIHIYTHRRQIPLREWHEMLTEVIESTGNHVMLGRRTEADLLKASKAGAEDENREDKDDLILTKSRKNKAAQDDEAWLQRMMNMAGEDEAEEGSDEERATAADVRTQDRAGPSGAGRSASVPPTTTTTAAPVARSASPVRSAAARSAAAWSAAATPSQSSRTPAFADPPRNARNGGERGARDSGDRDWRHVRDLPQHHGYTTTDRSRYDHQDWRDWKYRDRDPPRNARNGGERGARDSGERDWRHVRDTPKHHGHSTSDWSRHEPQARTEAQDWRYRDRGRGAGGWEQQQPRHQQQQHHQHQQQQQQPQPQQQQQHHHHQQQQPQPQQQQQQPQQQLQQPLQAQAQAPAPKERSKALQDEESRTSKAVRDQVAKCFECGRGKPLKLFVDEDDGNKYCHACWVEFYGMVPPLK